MRPTRWSDVVAVALIAGAAVFALLRLSYENIPALPHSTLVSLVILAGLGLSSWSSVSARLHGRDGARPITPLQLARTASLAKALSIGGGVIIGAWLGVLATVVGDLEIAAHRSDAITALLGLLPGSGILAAGLALERLCKAAPPSEDLEQDDEH